MLATSKSISGFDPRSIPTCQVWLDAADPTTMNSTTTVTVWNDKSGNSNNMTGTATLSGGTMTFDGSTQAFSNIGYAFPNTAYSMFAVYSNTTAPAASAYMNAVYGTSGYPRLGVYDVKKAVSASPLGNTGLLSFQTGGWVARCGYPAFAAGNGIATDTSGNVFVIGYSYATSPLTLYNANLTTGGTIATSGNNTCIIAKYSSAGTVLWGASGTNAQGNGIATDTSGNVFVTGYYTAALTLYNASGVSNASLANTGSNDCFVAKYSSAGSMLWAAQIASTGNDTGNGIATDTSGNVFVTGSYSAALTLYNASGTSNASLANTGSNDCFVAKYSSVGAVLWAARIASTGDDAGNGIATDTSGNVFVTGSYSAALTLYSASGTSNASLANTGSNDCFVAKYSSVGAVLWAARIASTGNDTGNGIATDTSGNVFVTGSNSTSPLILYNSDGTSGATISNAGCFIAKYSSAGTVLWAAIGTNAQGNAIATDASGNAFVTGKLSAAITLYNTGGTIGATISFSGGYDCFVAKYSSAGTVLWTSSIAVIGTLGFEFGNGVATDTNGNMVVTGGFGPNTLSLVNADGASAATLSSTGSELFVAKYSPAGFVTSSGPIYASCNVLVSATYTQSTLSLFVNGSNTLTLSGTTQATTGLYLGGPSNYFNGSISEVLIYGSTLSAFRRQSIEGYLNKKWGMALSNVHPFYIQPPMSRDFAPTDIPGASLWLDAADPTTMNSTTTVTIWNDKSGNSNTMTGTATWTGSNMTFNGSTHSFSNTTYAFPNTAYSMFAVYSNTTAPAASAYMNVMYGSNGCPTIGVYDVNKYVFVQPDGVAAGAVTGRIGWAARAGPSGNNAGNGIATDTSGNVFVTGTYFSSPLFLYNADGTSGAALATSGNNACFIAKYSSAGNVIWAASIDNAAGDAVATDTSGNVFVTGYYIAALTLYNASGVSNAALPFTGGYDCFVAKYSSAGSVLWAARIAGTGTSDIESGYGIATDTSGNVFVTGNYTAALTLYNSSGVSNAALPFAGGNYDCFVAKYSSAGSVLWAARIASTGDDTGYGIATDTSGNVFVTGSYTAALTLYNASGVSNAALPFAGGYDCFVAKYSSAGSVLWAARIAGTNNDFGNAIATDASGNAFVTGRYIAALTLYNASGVSNAALPFTGGYDCFVAKYSSAGSVLWAAQIAGTGTDTGYGIATDTSGNVFVTGYYTAALTLYNASGVSNASLANTGSNDCFVAKYSSAGSMLWATRIASTGNDTGNAIATDTSGNVFVTGSYSAALTLYNASGTSGTSLANTGSNVCFVAKYTSTGVIAGPINPTPTVLVSGTYTPSTFSPFINGYTETALSGTTLATTGIYVGGPTNYFNGSISEIIVYGATLTTDQRQQVEGYLSKKWDLRSQVVTRHPYNLIPPASVLPARPTMISNCTLWLDAADNIGLTTTTTVTVWNDKSGSNNIMKGTATWTGSNLTFNGTTQAFSNTTYVFPNTAYSMFAVYSNTTAPASTAYMNVVYGNAGYPMLGVYDVNKYVSARAVAANTGALVPNVAASSNVLVSATSTSSTFSPFVNGSAETALSSATSATTGVFVGGPTNYFNGSISEIIVYSATLTTSQRQQVEGYLAWKWGLVAKLPTTHPYFKFPPALT